MGTRVVINDRGLDQRGTDGTSTLEINVPLTLNSITNTGGNMGVGVDAGVGKAIGSLTLTSGGSGYTNGTYSQVALTGGSGTGATADIVVAANAVTTVVLRNPGQGYAVSDTLSCASIGAGSNFLVTVATTASILRSDGTVVGTRIGAGTTAPSMTIYAIGAIGASKFERRTFLDGTTTRFGAFLGVLDTENEAGGVFTAASTDSGVYGLAVTPRVSLGSIGATTFVQGLYINTVVTAPTTSGTTALAAANINAGYDASGTTGKTGLTSRGVLVSAGTGTIGAGNTFSYIRSVDAQGLVNPATSQIITDHSMVDAIVSYLSSAPQTVTNFYAFRSRIHTFSNAAHAVTNFYGLLLQAPSLAGGSTITNRWGVSQDDANANNVFAGRSAIGQAAGTAATALADVGASTTARASLRIRSGAAPTSPNDGDIWYDGSFLYMRVGASTLKFTLAP